MTSLPNAGEFTMNKRLIGWAEQGLIALAGFVLFLLLFADKIVVPVWLQPVGRMHPLLLHFPIVLLLLAMSYGSVSFSAGQFTNRVRQGDTNEPKSGFAEVYSLFLSNLLLIGTLLAGVTVIMGLFLSKEEGYAGDVLQWHKWSGTGIFYMAALVYWGRNKTWYTGRMAQVGAITTVIFLIGAGHNGARLTHGDNFLFAPLTSLTKSAPVPLDEAVVFKDVIQPIFEQKCLSCHNPEKLKGQLSLARWSRFGRVENRAPYSYLASPTAVYYCNGFTSRSTRKSTCRLREKLSSRPRRLPCCRCG